MLKKRENGRKRSNMERKYKKMKIEKKGKVKGMNKKYKKK